MLLNKQGKTMRKAALPLSDGRQLDRQTVGFLILILLFLVPKRRKKKVVKLKLMFYHWLIRDCAGFFFSPALLVLQTSLFFSVTSNIYPSPEGRNDVNLKQNITLLIKA